MSLVASGVQLSPDLASSLGQIGTKTSNNIKNNYGNATAQAGSDASARGMPGAGSYNTNRLNTTQGLDTGDLESVLGGSLGNTSYQDTLAQRDYAQQMQLADKVGSAAGLSSLEQVLGGVGSATKSATAAINAYNKNNGSTPPPAPPPNSPNGYPYIINGDNVWGTFGVPYDSSYERDPWANREPDAQSVMYQGG